MKISSKQITWEDLEEAKELLKFELGNLYSRTSYTIFVRIFVRALVKYPRAGKGSVMVISVRKAVKIYKKFIEKERRKWTIEKLVDRIKSIFFTYKDITLNEKNGVD